MGFVRRFGFGQPTGIDLPYEKSGRLPGNGLAQDSTDFSREALGLSIGQSQLTTTPLQIARAISAVANGGWLVTPHVVSPDGVARSASDIDDAPRNLSRRRITELSDNTLHRIHEGLVAAVEQPWGTAHRTVQLDDIAIAGKTGTAETGNDRPDHAWFAGYVPADKPRFTVVVVLEHGGSGGKAAGPIAREMVRKAIDLNLLIEKQE